VKDGMENNIYKEGKTELEIKEGNGEGK